MKVYLNAKCYILETVYINLVIVQGYFDRVETITFSVFFLDLTQLGIINHVY